MSKENQLRERHGFVTAWLWLAIVGGLFSCALFFVGLVGCSGIDSAGFGLCSALSLVDVIAFILLMRWKKVGFYLFMLSLFIQVFIVFLLFIEGIYYEWEEHSIRGSIYSSAIITVFFTLIPILSWWGVLHIRKNGISAWHLMDGGWDYKHCRHIYQVFVIAIVAIIIVTGIINLKFVQVGREELVIDKDKINGREYVDMGLSSGLKWATCNVGASKPSDYGEYFAWGEVAAKESYTKENCETLGETLDSIWIEREHDAAIACWGESWRLPTKAEFQELLDCCSWEWSILDGHKGYMVTSGKTGNSIFFPAGGFYEGAGLKYEGRGGYYWTSTPNGTKGAADLYFSKDLNAMDWGNRYCGLMVRAVCE